MPYSTLPARAGLLSALFAGLALGGAVLGGCSPRFTKAGADHETYGILDRCRPAVPRIAGTLRLDAADDVAEAARCRQTYRLTVEDTLALAAVASREYRRQREDVYLAALRLTSACNEFNPIFGAAGSGELRATGPDGETTFTGSTDLTLRRAFENGGGIAIALAQDFLKNLSTGDPWNLARTILSTDLLLPLGRGSGWVARENLTQAQRDTIYAMRDYARFQQEFTVSIASRYFRILRIRDTWRNEERTYENLRILLERQTAMGAQMAGRVPEFQVDQTRQGVLEADQRRLLARTNLATAVDNLKLDIGIPILVRVEIPDEALKALEARGPLTPPYDEDEGVRLAMRQRLDLENARDQEVDAWRHVLVAHNGLGAQVDLRLGGALTTSDQRPLDITDPEVEGLLGLDIDLPLERTTERNAFRTALIQYARARRLRQGREDDVIRQVREDFRNLERGRLSFEIQDQAVKLAERRVESTALQLQAGTASTRDRLDAEDSLVRARNGRVLALIDHAIARLELERDVGTLVVGADARWTETPPRSAPPPPPPPPPAPPAGLPPPPAGALPDPLDGSAPPPTQE